MTSGNVAHMFPTRCGTLVKGRTLLVHRDKFNYFHAVTRDMYWAFRAVYMLKAWRVGGGGVTPLLPTDLPNNILLIGEHTGRNLSSTPLIFLQTLVTHPSNIALFAPLPEPVCFEELVVRVTLAGFATGVDFEEADCAPSSWLPLLRAHILHHLLPSPNTTGNCTLLIVARQSTRRRIVNFEEMLQVFRELGIEYIVRDFSVVTIEEQIALAEGACGVMGMHGAGLTNAMFMSNPRGPLIEIMPYRSPREVAEGKQGDMWAVFKNFACGLQRPFYRYTAPIALPDDDPRAGRNRSAWVNASVLGELVLGALRVAAQNWSIIDASDRSQPVI